MPVAKRRRLRSIIAADSAAVAVSVTAADGLAAVSEQVAFAPLAPEWLSRTILITCGWLTALYVTGAYESGYLRMRGRSLYLTALATALAAAMCAGLFYLLPAWRMNRLAFGAFVALAGLLLTGNRLIWLRWYRPDKTGAIIAIGDHELLLTVWRHIGDESRLPRILWLVADRVYTAAELARLTPDYPHRVRMCSVERAEEILASDGGTHTVITDGIIRSEGVANLLTRASLRGALMADPFSFYEMTTGKCPIFAVDGRWVFNATAHRLPPSPLLCKRLLDFGAGLIAGVFALPILLLAAVAIVAESGFPVIYGQRRMGRHAKRFTLWKLRTMRRDAEAATGPVWSPPDDPRVTRVGQFLRRTGIDELPQLWNVLLGEMSLVGPRPERPEIVAELRRRIPLYMQRHAVPPGITGWRSINRGGDTCLEDVVESLGYDLYYAKNFSLKLDLRILLRTWQMVVAGAKPQARRRPRAESVAGEEGRPRVAAEKMAAGRPQPRG